MKSHRLLPTLLTIVLFLVTTITIAQVTAWSDLEPGTVVYVELLEAPPALYLEPRDDIEVRVENTLRFDASMTVSARHEYLDQRRNLRVRVVDQHWVQILPQPTRPSQYTSNGRQVYIQNSYLRLIPIDEFQPVLLSIGEHSPDRTIIVDKERYRVMALEGSRPVLVVPARMGPTPIGDFRTFRKAPTSDMPGFPGVPWVNFFTSGYALHGAPWWAWDEISRGSGGSHGCINLPGEDWYLIQHGSRYLGVAEWLWLWDANLIFDPTDQTDDGWVKEIPSDQRWYQVIDSVRVIVVNNLNDLYNYPLTNRMGEMASAASVQNWTEVIQSIQAVGDNWLLTHQDETGNVTVELIAAGVSIAELEGRQGESPYVMLACDQVERYGEPAYPGSSRTVGAVCRHLRVERGGSICTPERVDFAYLGKKTLCDGPRFDASTLEIRGELIEHENVHLAQFSGYFGTLVRRGIASDDLSPRGIDWKQVSLIGVTELMAQMMNVGSPLDEDYKFVLTRPNSAGQLTLVNNQATTLEAWRHLMSECGDPSGLDVELDSLLTSGLFGDGQAYRQLTEICSAPPHRLVSDRWR